MKKQQLDILNDTSLILNQQALLLDKPKFVQQQLFHLLAHRFMIQKKMMHKNLQTVLNYLPGTFSHLVLNIKYLALCIESKIQISLQDHLLLQTLVQWTQNYPSFKNQRKFSFTSSVIPGKNDENCLTYQQYLSFINFIGADLVKLIKKDSEQKKEQNYYNFSKIDIDDLLNFLIASLPRVMLNILLKDQNIPPGLRTKRQQALQILFKNQNLQYFAKTGQIYPTTIKILIKSLLQQQLKLDQQRLFMQIVFRYFYLFHHDKKFNATDFVIQAYNNLDQTIRNTLADQFILFLRIAKKIGKQAFVDFLVQKSEWIKKILSSLNSQSLIGHPIESIHPFNQLGLGESLNVPRGKVTNRMIQVFKDYSLLFFKISVLNHDVTLRIFYLGEISQKKQVRTLIYQQLKISQTYKNSCIAARSGIYQFQFDNSYSWINGKNIKFQTAVLVPLQYQTITTPSYISNFYDNIIGNQIGDKNKIFKFQKTIKKNYKQNQIQTDQNKGKGNISKNGTFFNMKITTPLKIYQFESQNQQKFIGKFDEIVQKYKNIQWYIGGQPLEQPKSLQHKLSASQKEGNKKKNKQILDPYIQSEKLTDKNNEIKQKTQEQKKQLAKQEEICQKL